MRKDLMLRHLKNEGKIGAEQKALAQQLDGTFEASYQNWYTESLAVIRQLTPNRLAEFEQLYKGDGKRREVNAITYCVQDWLNGVRIPPDRPKSFNDFASTVMRFKTQLEILQAVGQRFESTLFDIRQLVQADFFDSEVDAAHELAKKGFLRAAGAVAGVVLEKHLAQVSANHNITIGKKHPSIRALLGRFESGWIPKVL